MGTIVGIGTELKLNVNIEPIGDITMDDYDFEVDVYCSQKRITTIRKSEAIRVDDSNYIILVNTEPLGHGDVKVKVTAHIPDDDFDDGLRTEVVFLNADITVVKSV